MRTKLESPHYPANGNLRMYNMFPYRNYDGAIGIEGMTRYIPDVAQMGYNAVWINPLQAVGTQKHKHADGLNTVSGSLYAMSDDNQLNPTIFPLPDGIDPQKQNTVREEQLKEWTKSVRNHGMFPLFDLVLNHIGINDEGSPLQNKLKSTGMQRNLNLLLPEVNERWPDIQGIDYYKNNSKKRGLTTEPKDLDINKMNAVFETLWEPLITRYIKDYGFMGIRVDALTHVPVPVQQRAIRLVQKLVRETYNTDAIIVGELMVGNPETYIPALSACGLTHCLHPCGFFWGFDKEGGYNNTPSSSPFINQNAKLSPIVLPPKRRITSFHNLVISGVLDFSEKKEAHTIYLFKKDDHYNLILNEDETDICFGKAKAFPISTLGKHEETLLLKLLTHYEELLAAQINNNALLKKCNENYTSQKDKFKSSSKNSSSDSAGSKQLEEKLRALEKEKTELIANNKKIRLKQNDQLELILREFHQSKKLHDLLSAPMSSVKPGGLLGVVGNHDVGTLKAKTMLDIAYTKASSGRIQVDQSYNEFKQVLIKAAKNTDELIALLSARFGLSELENKQLFLDLNMRMREKIFIQSMMCSGGWYSLAGDELGVCHKPEVFQEFATGPHVGSSLRARLDSQNQHHDFRAFIRSINLILKKLPHTTSEDRASLHYSVLTNEISGAQSADILFMVLRYNAKTHQYYLIGHSKNDLAQDILLKKMREIFGKELPDCTVFMTSEQGNIKSYDYLVGRLLDKNIAEEGRLNKFHTEYNPGQIGFFKIDPSHEPTQSLLPRRKSSSPVLL